MERSRRQPAQESTGLRISLSDNDDDDDEEEEEWVPLQSHPVFVRCGSRSCFFPLSTSQHLPLNLMAWDVNLQHLYVWNPQKRHLCCLTLRFIGHSIEAAWDYKILRASIEPRVTVCNISLTRDGELLLLAGAHNLLLVYLHERSSTKDSSLICRSVIIGSQIFVDGSNFIQILQVSWHPCSNTHLGVLSSDCLFRLFDLSADFERPEQEFYLQATQYGKDAFSICPVAFAFGGEHLWDRFAIFFLFNDGSIHVLCPVVPFGSIYSWASIQEIYKDAQLCGMKSSNPKAVNNASLAIIWLESTFPELANKSLGGGIIKAHPYAPIETSLALQGPLRRLCPDENKQSNGKEGGRGHATTLFCKSILKDTIAVTSWSSGLLQIDALADELQPVWNYGSSPRLQIDAFGSVTRVAMICDPDLLESDNGKMHQVLQTGDATWMGYTPPLLRLALLDLSLTANILNDYPLLLVADPLILERMYCIHGGGIDSVMLRFLPFSDQASGKDGTPRAPTVNPVVTTCPNKSCSPSGFLGFVALADELGNSWILGFTSSFECSVINCTGMDLVEPLLLDGSRDLMEFIDNEESSETGPLEIISKELLKGPKDVPIPVVSASLRSLSVKSIEGRSALHHYFKLFHEKYVEYAHKVYVALKYHGVHLKKITDEQQARLRELQQQLMNIEVRHLQFQDQLSKAFEMNRLLEVRLQRFRTLPGVLRKPLSKAEHEFKAELERFTVQELDELRSSIEALEARLRRYLQLSQANMTSSSKQTPGRRKVHIPDAQVSQLRSLVKRLSEVNIDNSRKVKLIESELQKQEAQE